MYHIYSITTFFDKYNSFKWLFGFIIGFIVLIIFFFFVDFIIKFQKNNNINFFEVIKNKKSFEKKQEYNFVKNKSKSADFKKVKRPTRSIDKSDY